MNVFERINKIEGMVDQLKAELRALKKHLSGKDEVTHFNPKNMDVSEHLKDLAKGLTNKKEDS